MTFFRRKSSSHSEKSPSNQAHEENPETSASVHPVPHHSASRGSDREINQEVGRSIQSSSLLIIFSKHRTESAPSSNTKIEKPQGVSTLGSSSSPDPSEPAGDGTNKPVPVENVFEKVSDHESLSRDDIRALFFGAPYFILEKGKHGKAFPHAFFPWNNDLEVSDLTDRRYLVHDSFALATLHAHLPIPDSTTWKPSAGVPPKSEMWKRPMFDLGIFEVPNMLSVDGKEPGTVGLRYFLELPLAEKMTEKARSKSTVCQQWDKNHLQALEVTTALKHSSGSAKIGKHAEPQDRVHLLSMGPKAWKLVGVREVKTLQIIDRLSQLSSLHDALLEGEFQLSILDQQTCAELYRQLFDEFLFPPVHTDEELDPNDLKVQIESLVKVLTTPGAWIDFSMTEWRVRFGQLLWVLPPHPEYEFDDSSLPDGIERKWLLIQILLSIELLIRLDAALRLGVATDQIHISGAEMYHFNKLRNDKVDWDLVVAKRFLDAVRVKPHPQLCHTEEENAADTKEFNFFRLLKKKHEHNRQPDVSMWNCWILPRHARLQANGLLLFAKKLEWPEIDRLEDHFKAKIPEDQLPEEDLFLQPIPSGQYAENDLTGIHAKQQSNWPFVALQTPSNGNLGGWLSRTWLTGMVLPSEAASGLLMASLLENDVKAQLSLGRTAYLYGGFILADRSWWNIHSVVGRIFGPSGGTQFLGWVSIPQLPFLNSEGHALKGGWYKVIVQKAPSFREGLRIHDGVKVARESSPLGTGPGKVFSREFDMIDDQILAQNAPVQIQLQAVTFFKPQSSKTGVTVSQVSASFVVEPQGGEKSGNTFDIAYNVFFISAHSCQRPHGHAHRLHDPKGDAHIHPPCEHLPAHPLHKSYKYRVISIENLLQCQAPDPTANDSETLLVDATEQPAKDMFVRAWCAQVGRHALVAHVGRTCLSCAIREAKALQLAVIIRVGSRRTTS